MRSVYTHYCLILLFHKHETAVYNGNRIYHIVKHLSSIQVSHKATGIRHSNIYNGGIVMNLYIFRGCAEYLGRNRYSMMFCYQGKFEAIFYFKYFACRAMKENTVCAFNTGVSLFGEVIEIGWS